MRHPGDFAPQAAGIFFGPKAQLRFQLGFAASFVQSAVRGQAVAVELDPGQGIGPSLREDRIGFPSYPSIAVVEFFPFPTNAIFSADEPSFFAAEMGLPTLFQNPNAAGRAAFVPRAREVAGRDRDELRREVRVESAGLRRGRRVVGLGERQLVEFGAQK